MGKEPQNGGGLKGLLDRCILSTPCHSRVTYSWFPRTLSRWMCSKCVQGWGLHNLFGQPVPPFGHFHNKNFLKFSGNLPRFGLCLWPHVLSLAPRIHSSLSFSKYLLSPCQVLFSSPNLQKKKPVENYFMTCIIICKTNGLRAEWGCETNFFFLIQILMWIPFWLQTLNL